MNGYLPAETDVLDEAYAAYPRTRDYVVTAEPAPAEDCRVPGCDGSWHYDGQCVAQLGEVSFDGQDSGLPAELVASEDTPCTSWPSPTT